MVIKIAQFHICKENSWNRNDCLHFWKSHFNLANFCKLNKILVYLSDLSDLYFPLRLPKRKRLISRFPLSCCLPESDGWNTLESLLAFVLPSDPKVGWQEKRGANIRPHPWGWWSMLGIWDSEIVRCPARKWPQSGPGSEGKQCVNMATIWEYALQHRTYLFKKENIIEQK